ncbi:hypothetical protein C8J56DRAFT_898706 [Mycena floridula]|nr:hypothetical protein C8J56DRAFT_898706 [Mycena floridula]
MSSSAKEITVLLAIPLKTVYCLLRRLPGSFEAASTKDGLPRKLSCANVAVLLKIMDTQPDTYLDELQEEMELQGFKISLTSLCRYLHCNGLSNKRGHPFQLVARVARERDHARRADFRDAVQQYDPSQIVSVDEAAVDARNLTRNFGWSYVGEKAEAVVPYERAPGILSFRQSDSMVAITFRQFISGLLD